MGCKLREALGALGQYLKIVPGCAVHDLKDRLDVFIRDLFVKQVAHAVDENAPGLTPLQRQLQQVLMQTQTKAVPVTSVAHGRKAQSEALRVAILAARTDLRATGDRIPGGIRPLDGRVVSHKRPR